MVEKNVGASATSPWDVSIMMRAQPGAALISNKDVGVNEEATDDILLI